MIFSLILMNFWLVEMVKRLWSPTSTPSSSMGMAAMQCAPVSTHS